MPDARFIERMFERFMNGLEQLTLQVARVAWAIEAQTRTNPDGFFPTHEPCARCRSNFQLNNEDTCRACGFPSKEKADA